MSFPYNSSIPVAPNDPSVDQPDMLTNTNSINAILDVDLYTFNQTIGGQHKQVTFPQNVTPSNPTAPASVLYTALGTAASNQSDLVYKNSNGPLLFPVSMVRAFGTFPGNGSGAVVVSNGFNIASVSRSSGNATTTVTLTSGAVTGTSFLVIANCTKNAANSNSAVVNYNITGAGTFELKTIDPQGSVVCAVSSISFIVLQA